jgi:REP element-mobilizing transposase RayT
MRGENGFMSFLTTDMAPAFCGIKDFLPKQDGFDGWYSRGYFPHFDGDRYALHAWCVMPNHVHTLFTPQDDYKMSTIVHSWKSFTAHECNKLLGQTGRFWDREPFDRYIRNERHFRSTLAYIEENPVKAGLCNKPEDWLWSSARRR